MSKTEQEVNQAQEATPEVAPEKSTPEPVEEKIEKIESLEDAWSKADKHLEDMEAEGDGPTEKVEGKTGDCPPGTDCGKAKAQKPFKVINIKGKDVPIATEAEYEALASKGLDYTQKTQGVSEERKSLEAEYQKKVDFLEGIAKKYEESPPLSKQIEARKQPQTKEQREAQVYKEYDIDPEFASQGQMKMARDMGLMREGLMFSLAKNRKLEEDNQKTYIEREGGRLVETVKKARDEFPYEDIVDADGNNLTKNNLTSLLKSKAELPANKSRTIHELAVETVKEIHFQQLGSKQSAVPALTDEMTLEQMKEKYPKLHAKYTSEAGDQGVATYLKDKEKAAPTLKGTKREVETKSGKKEIKGIDSAFDLAFADSEILGG